jgi:hypothetical protein
VIYTVPAAVLMLCDALIDVARGQRSSSQALVDSSFFRLLNSTTNCTNVSASHTMSDIGRLNRSRSLIAESRRVDDSIHVNGTVRVVRPRPSQGGGGGFLITGPSAASNVTASLKKDGGKGKKDARKDKPKSKRRRRHDFDYWYQRVLEWVSTKQSGLGVNLGWYKTDADVAIGSNLQLDVSPFFPLKSQLARAKVTLRSALGIKRGDQKESNTKKHSKKRAI